MDVFTALLQVYIYIYIYIYTGLSLIFYFKIPWLFPHFTIFQTFLMAVLSHTIFQDSTFILLITEQLAHSSVFFANTAWNLMYSILVKQSGTLRNSKNLNII